MEKNFIANIWDKKLSPFKDNQAAELHSTDRTKHS